MQSMNEIRHHMRAIEQTRKITNAMYLISSARTRKIMPQMEYNRMYLDHVQAAMDQILKSSESFDHVYFREREGARNLYIVLAGDKGMAGSFNSEVLKFALPYVTDGEENGLFTLGVMAGLFFRKRGVQPDAEIVGVSQEPSLDNARHIVQDIFRLYDEERVDRVYVIFTRFVNSALTIPCIRRLLPLDIGDIKGSESDRDMIYHPSAEEMFSLLVPQYTIGVMYNAFMQSYVSEHCARMNAMQGATRNADELIKKLRSQYNAARQAAITQEITEITGAARALGNMEASFL